MFDFAVTTNNESVTVTINTCAGQLPGLLVALAEQAQVAQEALQPSAYDEVLDAHLIAEAGAARNPIWRPSGSDVEAIPSCGNCLRQLEPGTSCPDCSEGPDDPDGSDVELDFSPADMGGYEVERCSTCGELFDVADGCLPCDAMREADSDDTSDVDAEAEARRPCGVCGSYDCK